MFQRTAHAIATWANWPLYKLLKPEIKIGNLKQTAIFLVPCQLYQVVNARVFEGSRICFSTCQWRTQFWHGWSNVVCCICKWKPILLLTSNSWNAKRKAKLITSLDSGWITVQFSVWVGNETVLCEVVTTVSQHPLACDAAVVDESSDHTFIKYATVVYRSRPTSNNIAESTSVIANELKRMIILDTI